MSNLNDKDFIIIDEGIQYTPNGKNHTFNMFAHLNICIEIKIEFMHTSNSEGTEIETNVSCHALPIQYHIILVNIVCSDCSHFSYIGNNNVKFSFDVEVRFREKYSAFQRNVFHYKKMESYGKFQCDEKVKETFFI